MDTNINIEFDYEKIKFKLNLPIDLSYENEEQYYSLDHITIYECNDLNIDFNIFNNKIDILSDKLKKAFPNKEIDINSKNINCVINEEYIENKELIYRFINKYKNFNILIYINDYKILANLLNDNEYPNLQVGFKNSDEIISYKEFYDMYYKLNEIVEFINYYNLSPLEKVLLVYDIVKANKYKKEKQGENYGISRNLNEIINNDKIVCVGFSNLIDFLLKNLGIKSNTMILGYENKNIRHERNYIFLKDEKYNIDGMFFLDATWDSKKNDKYLDNYLYFLKPFNFFKFINKDEYVVTPSKFQLLEKSTEELILYIKGSNDWDSMRVSITLSQLINEYNPNTNIMLGLENKSIDELINIITEINKKYNQRTSQETFKNALYRVRKIEYINGILKQEIDEEYIDSVCDKYYKDSAEIKLLKALEMYERPTLDKDLKVSKSKSTEEDLLRMRLLRAFKEKINDKPENDYIKKM